MPCKDVEEVRKVWQKSVEVIRAGVQITEKNGRKYNNFPGVSENGVCHVRPHGRNAKDTYLLPDGRPYTKQCFWLNKSYVYNQIDDSLK